MQKINNASVNKTLAHTWYLYPILGILITVIWLWAFQAYHQPSNHQKLTLFFSTNIKSSKFIDKILKHYDKEDLRQVTPSGSLPSQAGYASQLQIGVNNADLLILDEETLKGFDGHDENFFVPFTESIKSKYLLSSDTYYSYEGKEYGVLLKEKEVKHYLCDYMDFDESQNYYITMSVTSVNLGDTLNADNAYYDNALTFMNYLIREQ